MWKLLLQNHDRILVGCAASWVTLAVLAYGRQAAFGTQVIVAEPAVASDSAGCHVPRDPKYYAAQWQQIANDYYAAHPVESATPPVITALLSDRNNEADRELQISPASHVVLASNSPQTIRLVPEPIAIGLPHQRIAIVGPPAVAAALAAGGLACMVFAMVWPNMVKPQSHSLECSASLRLELPRDWVQVRPSFRHRIKPVVIAISCLSAAIATWSMVQ